MSKFKRYNAVASEFASIADFLIIYIEEAHASDGWRFEYNVQIASHKTLDDRRKAAMILAEKNPVCPVVVDDIENTANIQYGGYFERLYIIQDGVIVYEGGRGPEFYKLEEVEQWLASYRGSTDKQC